MLIFVILLHFGLKVLNISAAIAGKVLKVIKLYVYMLFIASNRYIKWQCFDFVGRVKCVCTAVPVLIPRSVCVRVLFSVHS